MKKRVYKCEKTNGTIIAEWRKYYLMNLEMFLVLKEWGDKFTLRKRLRYE